MAMPADRKTEEITTFEDHLKFPTRPKKGFQFLTRDRRLDASLAKQARQQEAKEPPDTIRVSISKKEIHIVTINNKKKSDKA